MPALATADDFLGAVRDSGIVDARRLAESAAVSFPPSARENTMMAASLVTLPTWGNASF